MDIYGEMFAYVEERLKPYDSCGESVQGGIRYGRFDHTKRVFGWAMRLYREWEHKADVDLEALKIAAIFHDSGYDIKERGEDHGARGARICRGYMEEKGYPSGKTDFVCSLIAGHSDKDRLRGGGKLPMELILLMEADLLDDTGAHGIVADCWMEAMKEECSFASLLKHVQRFTLKNMQENPMYTPAARKIWEEKRILVEEFCRSLEYDLNPEG